MVVTMTNDKIMNDNKKDEKEKVKDVVLYNHELKHKYMNELRESKAISESTTVSYNRIFVETKTYEEKNNKDLNLFNIDEMEEVLYGFEAKNRNTIESYGRIISSYLNWCVNSGLIKENILKSFKPTTFEKYLSNQEIYFTAKQIKRFVDGCQNYQDAVIVHLLFIGAGGKQMSEIRNLKKTDIDRTNNIISLTNNAKTDKDGNVTNQTKRYLKVDDYTIKLIDGAIAQKEYYKNNGKMKEDKEERVRPITDLVTNDYVVRPSITKTDNWNSPIDKFVIYHRLRVISKTLGIDEFNAKLIQRSGMIYKAKQLLKNGELTSGDIIEIAGANNFNVNNYHNLRGLITVENVKKTYPKEFK